MTEAARDTIRLDKWLWQARFFKSRSLAAGVVSAGKVRVNSVAAAKPSRSVGPDDVLTFPKEDDVKVVRILACGQRRGPAVEAQALYEDLSPAPAPKQPRNPKFEGGGRPSGRDRRKRDEMTRRGGAEWLE